MDAGNETLKKYPRVSGGFSVLIGKDNVATGFIYPGLPAGAKATGFIYPGLPAGAKAEGFVYPGLYGRAKADVV